MVLKYSPANRRITPGALVRGLLFVVVFCSGLAGLYLGTSVTDRPGVHDAGILAKIYYTLGLFVLGGLDLGTPVGGPLHGRVLLWFAYFAAPAITATAVIEGVMRVLSPGDLKLRRLRKHVVIGGAGRIALLYLRELREREPNRPVVVVENSPSVSLDEARDVHRALIVNGDIASEALLRRLRLDRAERVLLLTGDDFINMDAATKALKIEPNLRSRIVAHVANLRLMQAMAHTEIASACEVFNTHQVAASHLVQTQLIDYFHTTEARDLVVLLGFGRFGHTVLAELQRSAPGKFDKVVMVDVDATRRAHIFDEQVGFAKDYRRYLIDGDMRDPNVWIELEAKCPLTGCEPVVIVGSGDDGTNLRTAMWLTSKYPDAHVVQRSFRRSTFAEQISDDCAFQTFSVADLLTQSLPAHWFGDRDDAPVSESKSS